MSRVNATLRILDANANRVREALRTIEDVVRFTLNDRLWSEKVKTLRHDFSAVMSAVPLPDLLAARDTPGDVGTEISTPAEGRRNDVLAILTAACKRVQEALRSMEEQAKTLSSAPVLAPKLEALRYRAYDLESKLIGRLHRAERFAEVRVYLLLTGALCRKPWQEVALAALAGGVDALQLREKNTLSDMELLIRAGWLKERCQEAGKLFIMNDRADVAALVGADGVHLGQEDLPVSAARKIVGGGCLIGVSTHNVEQARQAVLDGADYIGVGPMFSTITKPQVNVEWGVPGAELLQDVVQEVAIPHVAIGGISAENVEQLAAVGGRAVAVSAAILAADDPAEATRQLRRKLEDAVERQG